MAEFKLPSFKVESLTVNPQEIPWGVQMVNAPEVWDITKGKGIVVAILDTGIANDHPDLQGRVIAGRNFTVDNNADPNNFYDNNGHGTHVAGTIAAIANNHGVVGVAPEVSLLIGKVLGGDGSGSDLNIVNAIHWATDWRGPNGEHARVISMSLGGPDDVPELHEAVQYAVSRGVVVVAASGNDGDGDVSTSELNYPGAYPEVVEVGAIDNQKQLASFSDTNPQVDVVAPGVNIPSTVPGGWAMMSGTSMATPHVSGCVAMLIALNETAEHQLTEPEIFELLQKSSVNIGISSNGEGNGLIMLSAPVVTDPTGNPVVQQPVPTSIPAQSLQPDQPVSVPVQPLQPDEPIYVPTPSVFAPQPEGRLPHGVVKIGILYSVKAGPMSKAQLKAFAQNILKSLG
jgi:major intracellular serine protease